MPQFWCTSAGDEEGAEMGYRYQSELGEEYVVWIEEHEVRGEGGDVK